MDSDTSALAAAIGERVRQERQARHWTLDRLADAAGVSRRMLVNVEQGVTNPSVGTLLRISDALGVGLPALVEPPERAEVTVTRSGDGATLWTGEHGGRGVLVAGTEPPDVVELWDWTFAPGDVLASEPHSAGTRELLQVHEGVLVMTVGDEEHTLGPGDALACPGDLPHSYANPGPAPVRISLAVFEPGVGASTRKEAGDA
ncbi:MAG: XRE family transcriptional regulator [Nocardioidaceae bacterium]